MLDLLRRAPKPVEKRRIGKILHLKGPARDALKHLLRDMLRDGELVALDDGKVALPRGDGVPAGATMVEIVEADIEEAILRARPLEWTGEGPAPLARVRLAEGHPVPPIGARALARLKRDGDGWLADILRVADKAEERLVARLDRAGRDWRLTPTDRRVRTEFVLAEEPPEGAKAGDLVLAEMLPARRLGLPRARVVERIGAEGDPKSASLIAIFAQDIPTVFSPAALDQARRASPALHAKREDLRDLPLVTIDGADARDFDDAVFARPDPAAPGGFELIVAIADVAWYVRPGDALDRDAYARGNSCYFPDRVVPMLPERLSNDLCSLRPDEDRPVLAVHMRIDAEGRKLGHRFARATIRSARRFTYEEVQDLADGRAPGDRFGLIVEPLYAAYRLLAGARGERGALDLDLEERKVELDAAGRVASIKPRKRVDSHRLIEEFMILANVCAAETLEKKRLPCMYRVHPPPADTRIESLRVVLDGLGMRLDRSALRPKDFGRILDWAADKPWRHLVNTMVLRCQSLAVYAPNNAGHFGLALTRYAHFTSPIRRYADLLVHRALIEAGDFGEGGLNSGHVPDFAKAGEHISATERRAIAAERDAMARYMAAYLADRQGATFHARISGVQKFGLFVTLDEIGADGLIPVRALPNDFYQFDERRHTLTGRRGRVFGLGEAVEVRLREVEALTGSLTFELLDSGGKRVAKGKFPRRRR
ncbi:MAG: ribonuclease R [Tagaea sp.]|nr:ribonuclease R [Tagaea sp.]